MAGRPRSEAVDAALREAALATFVERGLEGLTLDEVARRAGVSRTALYRRWSSREALLTDALAAWRAAFDRPETQPSTTLAEMLDHLAAGVGQAFADPFTRGVLRRLLTLGPEGREILDAHFGLTLAPRRAAFAAAIRAAQQEGAVDRGISPSLAQDAVAGALAYALLSGAVDRPDFDAAAYTRALFATVGLDRMPKL